MKSFDVTSIGQLREFAAQILESITPLDNQAALVTLSGDLGAGKTTFTQELGVLLGIEKSEINSPTYVIEQRYPITNHDNFSELVHIDAYRLEQEDDPIKIGLNQTLQDPTKLVIIEWPEKIESFLGPYGKMGILFSLKDLKKIVEIK